VRAKERADAEGSTCGKGLENDPKNYSTTDSAKRASLA